MKTPYHINCSRKYAEKLFSLIQRESEIPGTEDPFGFPTMWVSFTVELGTEELLMLKITYPEAFNG